MCMLWVKYKRSDSTGKHILDIILCILIFKTNQAVPYSNKIRMLIGQFGYQARLICWNGLCQTGTNHLNIVCCTPDAAVQQIILNYGTLCFSFMCTNQCSTPFPFNLFESSFNQHVWAECSNQNLVRFFVTISLHNLN